MTEASATPLIEAKSATTGYGAEAALEDVTFTARAGERIGVLGPNGGGKTTLFRLLLGELALMSGELRLHARVAIVPQTERSRLDYPVSALDVATMGSLGRRAWWQRPSRTERRRARTELDRVGLGEITDKTFGELSGGQRQRVLIARALMQDAPLILMDEPFAGVDEPNVELLMGLIDSLAGEGRCLLIATHDVEQTSRWDSVLCLNRKQVAFGDPQTVLTRSVLERTYAGEIVVLPGTGRSEAVMPHHHHQEGERR